MQACSGSGSPVALTNSSTSCAVAWYVDISCTYTVPYIPIPVPPAALGITEGLPYLVLNVPTGMPTETISPSDEVRPGSPAAVETCDLLPTGSDCFPGEPSTNTEGPLHLVDQTNDRRPRKEQPALDTNYAETSEPRVTGNMQHDRTRAGREA